MRDRDGPRNGGHRSAESLRLLQKRIESVRRIVRFRGAWERARRHRRLLRPRGKRPRQCIGGDRRAETRNELPSLHECRPTPKDNTLTHRAQRSRRIIKTSETRRCHSSAATAGLMQPDSEPSSEPVLRVPSMCVGA
jgi:hypothetical protein